MSFRCVNMKKCRKNGTRRCESRQHKSPFWLFNYTIEISWFIFNLHLEIALMLISSAICIYAAGLQQLGCNMDLNGWLRIKWFPLSWLLFLFVGICWSEFGIFMIANVHQGITWFSCSKTKSLMNVILFLSNTSNSIFLIIDKNIHAKAYLQQYNYLWR